MRNLWRMTTSGSRSWPNGVWLCLLLSLFSACAAAPVVDDDTQVVRTLDRSPLLQPGYLLHVRVTVAGKSEINEQNLRIQENGTIILPFLGAVTAAGMTIEQFKAWLTEELDTHYFIHPVVSVTIPLDDRDGTYPWGFVTVLGRVKQPGRVRIPPTRDLTVMQAIRQAGGFEKYARETAIEITRAEPDGSTSKQTFNFRRMTGSSGENDIPLEHGDVVFVPEVLF